jgi:hypothetical protein
MGREELRFLAENELPQHEDAAVAAAKEKELSLVGGDGKR